MSKIKNGGLDQHGAGPFEQQQFITAGVKGVRHNFISVSAAITSRPTESFLCHWHHTITGLNTKQRVYRAVAVVCCVLCKPVPATRTRTRTKKLNMDYHRNRH